ncbi:N-acetylneuraminate synthase [Cohnella sp. OV330]|uniref:N-acetylneuraminate synthase family protein n=1 Tax=Cohnella sp. OV330 TaxID=1855288 RepID=UPI0008EF9CE4|nr:N-acetylneuraminate synthase family protein [Cohnella sp. OV330]SFB47840.1 N-acetylneuraminate synthase [Cohnella sp. OV330]
MNFNKTVKIGPKSIDSRSSVFIIAEAGVNHGGDLSKAFQLIDAAVESGADAVKFQAFKTEELILSNVSKAPYQKQTTDAAESQFDMLKKIELTKDQNQLLLEYCRKKQIIFLTTPFDEVSLDLLDDLNLDAYKVASTDINNLPFLRKIASKGKPVILSTGMSYMSEIELALQTIYPINKDVILLQCSANYPLADEEANLNVIHTYRSRLDILVGYSDHTQGIGAAPYSVPMGVVLVEKHLTLDRDLEGPDHKASIDPEQFREMVREIRKVETYLGSFTKYPTLSELGTRTSLQKYLVASKIIKKGDPFNESNVIAKRTGGKGIPALYFDHLVGKPAPKNFSENELIELIEKEGGE